LPDRWGNRLGSARISFGNLQKKLIWRLTFLLRDNVPLSALDTSHGITSDIIQLLDKTTGDVVYTAWVRELKGSGNVLYAGNYSLCRPPRFDGPCVKVVFPLPNGNAVVVMKPEVHSDGSFSLTSAGRGFGEPGFYFVVRNANGSISSRYVQALRETIRVCAAKGAEVRADHVLKLWGMTFLRLHYRLQRKLSTDSSLKAGDHNERDTGNRAE